MPATYEPIATTTLSSAANNITFSSIPSTYTDLRIAFTVFRTSALNVTVLVQFNGDTANNYSFTDIYGTGSLAQSFRETSVARLALFADGGVSNLASIPGFATIDLFSYAGSTNKTVLMTGSADLNGSGVVDRAVGLWRSTSAINSIKIYATNNFDVGTTATLYGILKA